MKYKLLILLLLVSAYCNAQRLLPQFAGVGFNKVVWWTPPPGYTLINSRYEWLAGMFDDGLHLPRYNGAPTNRTGVATQSGNVAVDTLNHKFYFRSGGIWREAGGVTTLQEAITASPDLTGTNDINILSGGLNFLAPQGASASFVVNIGEQIPGSLFAVEEDSIYFNPHEGKLNIDTLRAATDTTLSKPMTWNPLTGRWQYLPYWPTGSGGGGSQTPWTSNINADGYTLYGNDGANEDLTLEGTSNATKTTSYVIIQPTTGKVGINTTTPLAALHVGGVGDILLDNQAFLSWRVGGSIQQHISMYGSDTYMDNSYGHQYIRPAGDAIFKPGTVETVRMKSGGTDLVVAPSYSTGGYEMVVRNSTSKRLETVTGITPVAAATYTPTLTNTTNIAASTAYSTWYIQDGDWVHVWGEVSIDATTALTISEMGMSLPVVSSMTATYDLAGTGSYEDNTSVQIKADIVNQRAKVRFVPQTATNNKYSFHFSYKYYAP